MTRILSEILQAPQPQFSTQLRQLERASGHQNTDIKLSVEVTQATKLKLKRLGLDQHDTTAKELYQALLARVTADDTRLERTLRTSAAANVSAEANIMDGLRLALTTDAAKVKSFAMKPATIKRLLKSNAPKRVLKQLNYRSLESLLRQEAPATIVAAALQLESAAWKHGWQASYKLLKATDFEDRPAVVLTPTGERWQTVTTKMLELHQSTVIGLPELGAVIVLPIPTEHPAGMVIATVASALHELNGVASVSNYLRATQVQSNFAAHVRMAADGELALATPVVQSALPWHIVQQYFARLHAAVSEDVFGPYVQDADFVWHHVEERLAELCPSLEFWQDSHYLSFLEAGKTVSLNVLDAAVNACNELAFESRQAVQAQQALWHELTLRYLDRDSLEQAITGVLQPQLALETAEAK